MPAVSITNSPLRELAHRVSSGAEIRLFWNERTGAVTVWDWNRDYGQQMEFAVAPAKALDAYTHPYAHAASLGVSWYRTPQAA